MCSRHVWLFLLAMLGLALGIVYCDRLSRERELRRHIEATGARALSLARRQQDEVRSYLSGLNSAFTRVETRYSSATNEMADLRKLWGNDPDERVRQALEEAESELAKVESRLAAAGEVKARMASELELLAADLAEVEGMSTTNVATLMMVTTKCYDSLLAIRQSPDYAEFIKLRHDVFLGAERIVYNARKRVRAILNGRPRR